MSMSTPLDLPATEPVVASAFVERRASLSAAKPPRERRQFVNSHAELSPEAQELATAVDQYKLERRRRFIDFEEMLSVLKSLGYRK